MAVLAHSFNYMVAGLQEGSVYRDLLGRTVSPEVRDQLRQTFTSGNLRLEGQEAVATVLMTDIRAFTTLSERSDPSTVLTWLNEYFGRLVPIIQAHGGVVNKFDGDAMLAFFGILPRRQSPKNGARAACLAAMEMLAVIDQLNQERIERGDPPFVTGIGINTGVVIAGGLGTSDRLHYTIIGDTVNTTQRLESLTRQLFNGNGVVIGHSTYLALAEFTGDFNLEPAGMHAIKGKSEQILIYRMKLAETRARRGGCMRPLKERRLTGSSLILLVAGGIVGLALLVLVPNYAQARLDGPQPVPMQSGLQADYSTDPMNLVFQPVDVKVVEQAIIAHTTSTTLPPGRRRRRRSASCKRRYIRLPRPPARHGRRLQPTRTTLAFTPTGTTVNSATIRAA